MWLTVHIFCTVMPMKSSACSFFLFYFRFTGSLQLWFSLTWCYFCFIDLFKFIVLSAPLVQIVVHIFWSCFLLYRKQKSPVGLFNNFAFLSYTWKSSSGSSSSGSELRIEVIKIVPLMPVKIPTIAAPNRVNVGEVLADSSQKKKVK